MSFALVSGLGALIFGIGYNIAYKNYTQNKINLSVLKMEPRDTKPRSEIYYTVTNIDEFNQAEYEWNKYNEIRKYYYNLMIETAGEESKRISFHRRHSELWIPEDEIIMAKAEINWHQSFERKKYQEEYYELLSQCSDIKVESNAFNGHHVTPGKHSLILDRRFTEIYKEMISQGVTFEFRPGIDRLDRFNWAKGIEGADFKGWASQDIELISQGNDPDTLGGFKYIFTKYGLDNVHMDYKRFYKPQYI